MTELDMFLNSTKFKQLFESKSIVACFIGGSRLLHCHSEWSDYDIVFLTLDRTVVMTQFIHPDGFKKLHYAFQSIMNFDSGMTIATLSGQLFSSYWVIDSDVTIFVKPEYVSQIEYFSSALRVKRVEYARKLLKLQQKMADDMLVKHKYLHAKNLYRLCVTIQSVVYGDIDYDFVRSIRKLTAKELQADKELLASINESMQLALSSFADGD